MFRQLAGEATRHQAGNDPRELPRISGYFPGCFRGYFGRGGACYERLVRVFVTKFDGFWRGPRSHPLARHMPPRYEIGIEFLDMSSDARERLNGFVAWLAALPTIHPP